MGNSSSCDSCVMPADLKSITDEVSSLSSSIDSSSKVTVPTSVEFSAGDGDPVSTPTTDVVEGWLRTATATASAKSLSSSSTGALQMCPSDQVMCGIQFLHESGDNLLYEQYYKIECCNATLN